MNNFIQEYFAEDNKKLFLAKLFNNMRKLFLPVLLFMAFYTQAQTVCVPGTQTSTAAGYILPDSATNFVHGCPGFPYEQIVYMKAPKDTTFTITLGGISGAVTANIDSFIVDADFGLPTYLTLASVPALLNPAGAAFPKSNYFRMLLKGDSLGCAKISGNVPVGTAAGNNNLNVNIRAYLSGLSSPNIALAAVITALYPTGKLDTVINIDYYNIIIDPTPCGTASVNNLTQFGFEIHGAVPNPFSGQTQLQFEAVRNETFTLTVMNSLGQTMLTKEVKSVQGMNYLPIPAAGWSSGTYSYHLHNGKNQLAGKMQIN